MEAVKAPWTRKQSRRPHHGVHTEKGTARRPTAPPQSFKWPFALSPLSATDSRRRRFREVMWGVPAAAARRVGSHLYTLLCLVLQLLGETVFAPLVWLFSWLYQFPADVQFRRTTQRYIGVLRSTESYKTYLSTARLLDAHLGIDEWRLQIPSRSICNAEGLVFDAEVALALAASANPIAMGYFLRSMLLRNAHGMTHPKLFPYLTGTKACVEDYCAAVCVLISVFGGSKPASAAAALRIRPCYAPKPDGQEGPPSAFHAGCAVVDLTALTKAAIRSQAVNTTLSTGHGIAVHAHALPRAAAAPFLSVNHPKAANPNLVSSSTPSGEDDMPVVSSSSSHDIRVNGLLDGLAPSASRLVQAPSHMTVSATSSEGPRPPRDRCSTASSAGKERVMVPSCHLPTESSFLQNMLAWAEENAVTRGGGGGGDDPVSGDDAGKGRVITAAADDDDDNDDDLFALSEAQRLTVLKDVLRSYGRTALILSGGASMGTYHTGVVRALYEANSLPDIISGSSAGSIISAIICTKSPKQLKEFVEVDLLSTEMLQMSPFGNDTSLMQKLTRLFKTGFLMDVRTLMECIRGQCGDMTFQEAYALSGRVLNITVTRENQKGTHFDRHVLLNYLTAPNVVIWSAVSASSALPGLFTAVQLIEKSPETGFFEPYLPGELYCDGSVAQDIPRSRLAQLFNVNFFVVSQVNPYVIPFVHSSSTATTEAKLKVTPSTKAAGLAVTSGKVSLLGRLWYGWANVVCHVMLKCFYSGLFPKTGAFEVPFLLLTQSYSGNITILPIGDITSALPDYLNMASNPTAEYISYVATRAQVRTWPLVTRIKSATCIERALLKEIVLLERAIRRKERELPPR